MIQASKDPFTDSVVTRAWTPVTDEVMAEIGDAIDAIRALYSSSWLESMNTPRTVRKCDSPFLALLIRTLRNIKVYQMI